MTWSCYCWERWDKLGTLHSPDVRSRFAGLQGHFVRRRGSMINEAVGMNSRELIVVLEIPGDPVGSALEIDNISVFESHNFKARDSEGQLR